MPLGQRMAHVPPEGRLSVRDPLGELVPAALNGQQRRPASGSARLFRRARAAVLALSAAPMRNLSTTNRAQTDRVADETPTEC
jgi:hypothetical protein